MFASQIGLWHSRRIENLDAVALHPLDVAEIETEPANIGRARRFGHVDGLPWNRAPPHRIRKIAVLPPLGDPESRGFRRSSAAPFKAMIVGISDHQVLASIQVTPWGG